VRKKLRQHLLRTYTAIAREHHHCSICQKSIDPGDEYEGRVIALGNGKLLVRKEHSPYCHDLDDPEEERRKDNILEMPAWDETSYELPLAA
jgi:hypothetical protein